MEDETATFRGYLIALIGTAVWSASAVFISFLATRFGMPAMPLAFWRDFLTTVTLFGLLLLFARSKLHLERCHLPFFVLYGFILAVFNSLWTISVALNGAAVATVLIYVSPAFTALIGWRWLGETITGAKVVAIVLCLIGCVFASGAHDPNAWELNSLGIAVGVSTGLVFAFYSLMGKKSSTKDVGPWTATLFTFAFGSAFLLFLQRPDTLFWLSHPLRQGPPGYREAALGWATIFLLAIGPTLGGYGLYTVSLTYLPTSTANLILTLEPAMTAGLAFVFLGEQLTAAQLLGGALVLVGVFVLRFTERRAKSRRPAPSRQEPAPRPEV